VSHTFGLRSTLVEEEILSTLVEACFSHTASALELRHLEGLGLVRVPQLRQEQGEAVLRVRRARDPLVDGVRQAVDEPPPHAREALDVAVVLEEQAPEAEPEVF